MVLRLKRFDSLKYYNYICIWVRRKIRPKYSSGPNNIEYEHRNNNRHNGTNSFIWYSHSSKDAG